VASGRMLASRTRLPFVLFVAFLIVFLAGQAVRPLTDRTEARYAEIAREMLVSGDWLIPHLDGVPRLNKPPLTTWLMVGSMTILGQNEIAARLPGILAFLGTILLVAKLAAVLSRREYAPWAALLYGLCLAPLLGAVYPSTDTLLACFETAAATAYVMHRFGSPRARWWFFIALGAAFLTKGPPGLLVPAAVVIGDRLLRGKQPFPRAQRPLLSWIPGWLCFAVVGLGWYLVVAIIRPDTMNYWLDEEVFQRIFTTYHRRNQSPLIYLVTLVLGTSPWWFPIGDFFKKSKPFFKSWREGRSPILVAWLVLPLVVFVLSRSRLPAYLLPLFPALMLILALEVPRRLAQKPGAWFGIRPWLLVAYAAFLAAVSLASIPFSDRSSWKNEAESLRSGLEGQNYTLTVFTTAEAGSLEFYLAPKRIDLLDASGGSTSPGPTKEGQAVGPRVLFTRESDASPLQRFSSPALIGIKRHRSVWLVRAP
jgi:4-amino-4-deoxy-L-arabinose transferase-like glycosyltransferase